MAVKNIYTVGGTVQASDGIYITRKADKELLELCRSGDFAYVLTSRQMGKSSLMVRTANELSSEGIRSVIIDLTEFGIQLSSEAWYLGILTKISDQLNLKTNVVAWWRKRKQFGDAHNLSHFFETVLLAEISESILVFIDEIDSTLSLSFTDDFYAAIRYTYNARATKSIFKRLSFVLIGVATPGDLISDQHRTPFNIGQRVDLSDFTLDESRLLTEGLGSSNDKQVMQWILKWTGGHPYLTQQLCRTIAEQYRKEWTEKEVETAVASAFLGEMSERDNNLQFVRDMLTRRSENPLRVLLTYREIRQNKQVKDDAQSAIKNHLKLSGIVKRENGKLLVRNRIYENVFDSRWLSQHWPTSWLATVPRGVKVASGFIVLLLVTSISLAIAAFNLAQQKSRLAEQEQKAQMDLQRALAQEQEATRNEAAERRRATDALQQVQEEKRRTERFANLQQQAKIEADSLRFVSEANESLAIASAESARARQMEVERLRRIDIAKLLAAQAPQQKLLDEPELGVLLARQAYLWSEGQLQNEVYKALRTALNAPKFNAGGPTVFRSHTAGVRAIAFSADGRLLASGGGDGTIRIWNIRKKNSEPVILPGHQKSVRALAFSPKRQILASGSDDGTLRLWNLLNPEPTFESLSQTNRVWAVAFSSDGQTLASGGSDSTVYVWKLKNQNPEPMGQFKLKSRIRSVGFSSESRLLIAASDDGKVKIWDLTSNSDQPKFDLQQQSGVKSVAYSPTEPLLATSSADGRISLWRCLTQANEDPKFLRQLLGHEGPVNSVAFSPDGKRLVSAGSDRNVRLWDLTNSDADPILLQDHQDWVWSVAFSPDGTTIVSGSKDKTVRSWITDTQVLADKVCEIAGRNLSLDEWQKFIGEDIAYERTCSNLPPGEGIKADKTTASH